MPGDAVDARTDIYSLGCVPYEMLTGEPPFTGRTAKAVVAALALGLWGWERARVSGPDASEPSEEITTEELQLLSGARPVASRSSSPMARVTRSRGTALP